MKTSLEEFRLTLRTWTDGPKLVVDTMSVGSVLDIAQEEGINVVAFDLSVVSMMIRAYPWPVGTFFVIAPERDANRIEEIKSQTTLDVRHIIL